MTIKELIRAVTGRSEAQPASQPETGELSDAYLATLQRDIDSNLKKDIKFTSVSRASW